MPYKQVFAHVYDTAPGTPSPASFASILPDMPAELLASTSMSSNNLSTLVLEGSASASKAVTPDNRYRLELDFFSRNGLTEFWLLHTDAATGRVRRAKLNTESQGVTPNVPRLAVSPRGNFFLVDDSGVVRIYSAVHLSELGVFQVAHSGTENAIIALAVSADEYWIGGLSRWKDIILYNLVQRRVSFVRQVRDPLGWYDRQPAQLLLSGGADVIITVGANGRTLSANAFQSVPSI